MVTYEVIAVLALFIISMWKPAKVMNTLDRIGLSLMRVIIMGIAVFLPGAFMRHMGW